MTNKTKYSLILFIIIIISFPSICFSELKTVEGENCDVYLGDLKNKKELEQFRKDVKKTSIVQGIYKIMEPLKNGFTDECVGHVISNYLEKLVVVSHTEIDRKICDKVKITSSPEVINKYLSQEICKGNWFFEELSGWEYDINNVLTKKSEKINIGLIIETKIPDIQEYKRELLENDEEKQFFDMLENNKDIYKLIDRRHIKTILEEQKLSSSGITDNETVKLGNVLNLDIIVLRIIYENSKVTKVLKVDTGEVLLFKTYKPDKP